MQLQMNLIRIETVTGKTCPADGMLTFLDPLLSGAAQVVKVNDGLGSAAQVGHDKSDSWEHLALVPFDLGNHPPCWISAYGDALVRPQWV